MKIDTLDLVIVVAALLLASVTAQTRADETAAMKWKMSQLYQPSADQLRREQRGHVFIYDGLKDKDIDRAMNTQFERLDRMMFTRVVVTNKHGETNVDSATGEVEVLDDGCD